MSILDQNFAPTPQQDLAAAPRFIPPVPDRAGNALVSNLKDLAGAFDKTYVARLKLKAQQERQGVLDKRYADTLKREQARTGILDKRYADKQKLDAKHYDAQIARQKQADMATAAQRVISNARADAQLALAKKSATRLGQAEAARAAERKRVTDQNKLFRDYQTGKTPLPAKHEGETDLAYGRRVNQAIAQLPLTAAQQQRIVAKFSSSDAGRLAESSGQKFTADLTTYTNSSRDYAKFSGVANALKEEIKTLTTEHPNEVITPDTPEHNQVVKMVNQMQDAKNKALQAASTAQTLVNTNPDLQSHTGKPTTQMLADLRAEAERKRQEAAARVAAQHAHSSTDAEAQIQESLGGFTPSPGTAMERAMGAPGAHGGSIQIPSAHALGAGVRSAYDKANQVDASMQKYFDGVDKRYFFDPIKGFISGIQGK